jgi:hypothetical protein
MADKIVSWGGFDSKGTDGMGITGSLSVDGSTFISSSNATQLQVGNNSLFVSGSGRVGIGTTSPKDKLDVNGTIRTSGGNGLYVDASAFGDNSGASFDVLNLGSTRALRIVASTAGGWGNILLSPYGANVGVGTLTPTTAKLQVKGSGTTNATTAFRVENSNASNSMVVLDNGFVGIGRIPSSYTVDISGSFRVQTNTLGLLVNTNGSTQIDTTSGNNGLYINDNAYSILKLGDYRFVQGRSAKTLSIRDSADIDVMFFASGSRNVGIGTTSPTSLLTLQGNNLITFTAVSAQNQISTIETDSSDNLLITAGIGSGKTITIGNKTNRILRIGGGTNTYQNSVHDFKDFLGISQLYIDSTSNLPVKVGIGTTTPTSRLQVKGSGTTSATTAFRVENANASGSMVVLDDGNVGIGTTAPLNKFTVVDGNSNIGGNYDSPFYLSFSRSSSGGSPAATYFSFENFILSGTDSFSNSIGKQIYTTISATGPSTVYRNIISRVHTTSAGAANSIAQYAGHWEGTGTGTVTNWYGTVIGHGGGVGAFQNVNTTITNTYGLYLGTLTAGAQTNAPYAIYQGGTEKIYIQGNVGIGTTSPTSRLQVKGSGTTSATTAFRVENSSATSRLTILDDGTSAFNTNALFISSSGNVGIGTTNPAEKLHVYGGASAIKIDSTTNEASLKYDNSTTTATIKLANNDLKTELGGSERMRILANGNVGIGTTSPSYKLDVSGSGNFTDNLTVTGSATISNILTLIPQDPLPTGSPTGSFAVSSSAPPKPYFYDGTVWNALY